MVYKDTLFLYVGCDEKDAPRNSYLMREYRLYTTTDMVNWTDRGAALRTSAFAWSAGDASAAQCIARNGKFYWYVSSQNRQNPGSSIGVAVADSPYGPFRDALGRGLVTNDMTTYARHSWDDLDPTVFVDHDGQAWLYWGNGVCYRARLNADMVSLAGEIEAIDRLDSTSFSGGFTEAPWLYERGGRYYLVYASGFPESIHYSMSRTAGGKWEAQGVVMPRERGSNTNHPAIVDYKGRSYFFLSQRRIARRAQLLPVGLRGRVPLRGGRENPRIAHDRRRGDGRRGQARPLSPDGSRDHGVVRRA